ncbi:MAG: hypothetical protein OXI80_13550 [Caldilineaceae bacterium]|nr:hypothetical protein [Caldilineaceae bacterium]
MWPQQTTGYLMITPAIFLLLLLILYAPSNVFRLSFFEITNRRDQLAAFAGLRNLASPSDDSICRFGMKNKLFSNLFS